MTDRTAPAPDHPTPAYQDGSPAATPPNTFSQAFRNFVGDNPKDIEGLLAYALYKQSITEDRERGLPVQPGASRNPGSNTIDNLRRAARTLLQEYSSKILEAEKPGLQRTAIWAKLDEVSGNLATLQTNIITHVERRTRTWAGVKASVYGWFLSIALTILIVVGFSTPNPVNRIIDWLKAMMS
ncbi:hypothetical protein [Azospirillum argentinense]